MNLEKRCMFGKVASELMPQIVECQKKEYCQYKILYANTTYCSKAIEEHKRLKRR